MIIFFATVKYCIGSLSSKRKNFRLEAFCHAFVFHCLATLKSFTLARKWPGKYIPVYFAIRGHCYATLLKIHIHLTAFDQLVYKEIELIALTLMTSSKPCTPADNDHQRLLLKW